MTMLSDFIPKPSNIRTKYPDDIKNKKTEITDLNLKIRNLKISPFFARKILNNMRNMKI